MAARVTAKAGACLLMLLMALGSLAVAQVSPPPTPPPPPPPPGFILPPDGSSERTSLSAALHLHGLSNQGTSTEPASITWHTQQHAAAGVDLLWWTDHFDIYGGRFPDFLVTPTTPVAVTPGLWTVGTWGPGADGSAFLRSRAMPSVISASGLVTLGPPVDRAKFCSTRSLRAAIGPHGRGATPSTYTAHGPGTTRRSSCFSRHWTPPLFRTAWTIPPTNTESGSSCRARTLVA